MQNHVLLLHPPTVVRMTSKLTLQNEHVLVSCSLYPSFLQRHSGRLFRRCQQPEQANTAHPPALLPFICESVHLLGCDNTKNETSAQKNNSLPASDWQTAARSEATSANLEEAGHCSMQIHLKDLSRPLAVANIETLCYR